MAGFFNLYRFVFIKTIFHFLYVKRTFEVENQINLKDLKSKAYKTNIHFQYNFGFELGMRNFTAKILAVKFIKISPTFTVKNTVTVNKLV